MEEILFFKIIKFKKNIINTGIREPKKQLIPVLKLIKCNF